MTDPLNIVVTGSVAVGKTYIQETIISHIHEHEVNVYPEFIQSEGGLTDDDFALKILDHRFKNKISALTFQNFILDKWERNIEINKDKQASINIFERLPDDAVEVFAKMSLSDLEYQTQIERMKKFSSSIISYKSMTSNDTIWIRYENVIGKQIMPLLNFIDELISGKRYRNIVIEVRCSSIYENYKRRDRKEEFYTSEELVNLYDSYCKYTDQLQRKIDCEILLL